MKSKQPPMAFSSKLTGIALFGSIFLLFLDVQWPVIEIFGFRTILLVYLLAGLMLLSIMGFVLGVVAGVAARKGRRQRASQAPDEASGEETSSPSPVGEVVMPKQGVEQSLA